MASFGEQLRQAREARNITLQEISAATKISSRALNALESDRFDQLPGGIFNKGFVRAYARYVGLDEEKTVAGYMAAANTGAAETDMQTMSNQIAAAQGPARGSEFSGSTLMGVLAVLVALALGAVWLKEHRQEVRDQAASASTNVSPGTTNAAPQPMTSPTVPDAAPIAPRATSPVTSPATSPATTAATPPTGATPGNSGTGQGTQSANPNARVSANQGVNPASRQAAEPGSGPVAVAGGAVEVLLTATQPAWISVRSDGKLVDTLTLDPANPAQRSRSYKASGILKVVVGNAGGITAVINGKPTGALGKAGQPVTVTFTPQGLERR